MNGILIPFDNQKKLPYDQVNCTDIEYRDHEQVYDGTYSFVQCKKSCVQRMMLQRCHCIG